MFVPSSVYNKLSYSVDMWSAISVRIDRTFPTDTDRSHSFRLRAVRELPLMPSKPELISACLEVAIISARGYARARASNSRGVAVRRFIAPVFGRSEALAYACKCIRHCISAQQCEIVRRTVTVIVIAAKRGREPPRR